MKIYSEKVYMYIVYLKSGWVPGLHDMRNSCFRVSQNISNGCKTQPVRSTKPPE